MKGWITLRKLDFDRIIADESIYYTKEEAERIAPPDTVAIIELPEWGYLDDKMQK